MDQIVNMLKKFSNFNHFFHPAANRVEMGFTPFVMMADGKPLQVMQASENDIPAMLELEKEVYAGQTPWSGFSFATELRKKKNSLYLVVYCASDLVAFIGARFHPRETHITNLAVAPAFQNKHIGSRLLQLMIKRAIQNGSELMSLEVKVDNQPAKDLYRFLGFEATFIRKNYYQDTHTDAINMVLWLDNGRNERRKFE